MRVAGEEGSAHLRRLVNSAGRFTDGGPKYVEDQGRTAVCCAKEEESRRKAHSGQELGEQWSFTRWRA